MRFKWESGGVFVSARTGRPLAKTEKEWDDASVAKLPER